MRKYLQYQIKKGASIHSWQMAQDIYRDKIMLFRRYCQQKYQLTTVTDSWWVEALYLECLTVEEIL